jgi:hypothetical protein
MGTRHLQTVIDKKGKLRISQYGQWDGYPSGQGTDILNYLRGANLKRYQEQLEKIKPITAKKTKEVESFENWNEAFYFLSRDCGSRLHYMIEWGAVPFVWLHDEKVKKWGCAGFYTIDFKRNVFISEYEDVTRVYALNELPTNEQYLLDMKEKEVKITI